VASARILAITAILFAALVTPTWLAAQEPAPAPPAAGADQSAPPDGAAAAATVPAEPAPGTEPGADPAAAAPPAPAAAEPAATPTPRAATSSVTVKDFSFGPASITVHVGDSVSWVNRGPSAHSATADDGSFDTGIFAAGQTRAQAFASPGTIAYHCTPHPFMTGTVRVLAASSSAGGGGSGSGGGSAQGSASGAASGGASAGGSEAAATASPAAAGSSKALPSTGSNTAALAVAGALLLAAGLLAGRSARQPRA
jgi:LPXTG-motif cell wall-anchored protein